MLPINSARLIRENSYQLKLISNRPPCRESVNIFNLDSSKESSTNRRMLLKKMKYTKRPPARQKCPTDALGLDPVISEDSSFEISPMPSNNPFCNKTRNALFSDEGGGSQQIIK